MDILNKSGMGMIISENTDFSTSIITVVQLPRTVCARKGTDLFQLSEYKQKIYHYIFNQ